LLASTTIAPAAVATVVPPPGIQTGTTGAAPLPATTICVVTAGGMAGWQTTLIALGAALLAAAAGLLLHRALPTHRAVSATAT
jgi:hypothetical protein